MLTRKQAQGMENLELINIINFSEAEIWRLKHDETHGRTTEAEISPAVSQYETQRKLAYEVLTQKTGISDFDKLSEFARSELHAQDKNWDYEWSRIHREGAVFKVIPGKIWRAGNCSATFEVLGAYVSHHTCCSFKEVIIARNWESGNYLAHFDERDIPGLERITAQPRYIHLPPEKRGLIKANECVERRNRGGQLYVPGSPQKNWGDYNFSGKFIHLGFGKFWTDCTYNNIEEGRDSENEIILARPLSGQKFWVEFTKQDLPDMELIKK